MGFGSVRRQQQALAVLAAILGVVVIGSASALAAGTTTSVSGNAVAAVKVVRDPGIFSTNSTSLVDVAGATTTITVPANTRALLIARFEASEICAGVAGSPCEVRLFASSSSMPSTEMQPASINNPVFDTAPTSGTAVQSAHEIERSLGPLNPGTYTVKVQFRVHDSRQTMQLTFWNLTVERVKA